MSELLEFIKSHEEAFRSHARLASLYSDFRYQRSSNPDGYQANSHAWLKALTAAAKAGLIPSQSGTQHDRLVLHTGEGLSNALQTRDFGRPLALGAAIEDAAKRKELIQLKEFLDAKKSVYAKTWVPTPWQVLSWGLRQLGLAGTDGEDRLVAGDFVVMANVEAASKAVIDRASKVATSNTSRVYSADLFASTFSSAVGVEALSSRDISVLLKHLSRDKEAISYSPSSGTIKFKAPSEATPTPITEEDVSIANLRTMIASLEPQVQRLSTRMTELDKTARDHVANKQLTSAKATLRLKKLTDESLKQRTATLTQLEEIYAKIEQAADQVEIVKVMESSSKTLKSLNAQTGGVEKVQDVVDGLKEEMMNADEIGQAIQDASAGTVDEAEVDEELEELERVEREKQEEAERKEREKQEEAARKEREKKEAEEAEATRKRLAELDQMGEKEKSAEAEAASEEPTKIKATPEPDKVAESAS